MALANRGPEPHDRASADVDEFSLPAVEPGAIRSVKLGREVASYLRDLIFSGQLRPGARLRLQDLASRLGVSTTPVREALLVLDKEGLIESEQHKGFRVRRISPQDVRDIYGVHAFAASMLAARAAEVITDEQLDTLRGLDAEIRRRGAAGEVTEVEQLNYQFHRLIHSCAPDSEVLRRFLRETTRYVPRRVYMQIEGWFDTAERDHGPIIDALAARDARNVSELMSRHVIEAGELLVEHLQKIGIW